MPDSTYTLYKTTNLVNGMVYVGAHKEKNWPEMDEYLGSGRVLHRAIKKYGRENFKREILNIVESLAAVMELERLYVTAEFCELTTNYNLVVGGGYNGGGYKNKPLTAERRKAISEFHKNRKRKPFSDATKRKMSESAKKRKHTPHTEATKKKIGDSNRGSKGFTHTEETKRKIADAGKNRKPISEETRQKLCAAQKKNRAHTTEETRRRMREAALNRHTKTKTLSVDEQ